MFTVLQVSTHEGKERVRYFPDDDHLSLNDLVKSEKMGADIDQDRLFMRMASKVREDFSKPLHFEKLNRQSNSDVQVKEI